MLEARCDRRAVVRFNGDIDELHAISLRNVGRDPYEFKGEWIKFPFTDALSEFISCWDSAGIASAWGHEHQENGQFLVSTQPVGTIAPSKERVFATHVLRRDRAYIVSAREVRFDDPVLPGSLDAIGVVRSVCWTTVIFPEHEQGWKVLADGAIESTSRVATWNFSYGPSSCKHIRATAKTPAELTAILPYDDIVADLHEIIGAEFCGETMDLSSVLSKIRTAKYATLRESTAPLQRGIERDRAARLLQFQDVLESLRKQRPSLLRRISLGDSAAFRGVLATHTSRTGRHVPFDDTSLGHLDPLHEGGLMPSPIDVFFSYSHKDEALRDELATHLKLLERTGVIRSWHDRRIGAGEEWKAAIDANIEKAHAILLLVSSDFLASDYCYDVEMKRALARHDAGEAAVLPVILRDCRWSRAPFAKLQALPKDAKPVTSWSNRDEAWTNVAAGIEAAAARITGPLGP
jgi:TIR domain